MSSYLLVLVDLTFHLNLFFATMSELSAGFDVEVTTGAPSNAPEKASKRSQVEKNVESSSRVPKKKPLHKHTLPSNTDAPAKRHKVAESSPSQVSSNLGSLAEPFIKDAELKGSHGRSEKEIQCVMAKASVKLYYYTMTRLTSLSEQEARLKSAEAEKVKLKGELSEAIRDNGRLKKNLDAQIAASKKEE